MTWKKNYNEKLKSIEEVAMKVKSNDKIWLPVGCSAPLELMTAIEDRYKELENVELFTAQVMFPFKFFRPEFIGHINVTTVFMGPVERMMMKYNNVTYYSVHLSKFDYVLQNYVKANVLVAEVSPPDENGYMTYGPLGVASNHIVKEDADMVLVQVNKLTPKMMGNGITNRIHVSEVNYICEKDRPMVELPQPPLTDIDRKIASHIIPLVEDGSCLQIGLGGTANAVGYGLDSKKDLGVHTEMFTDSLVYLAKKGVITNSKKNHNKDKFICGFGLGNQELYDFMDGNEDFVVKPIYEVNEPTNIAKNDKMVSINSCLMVDLTGQICSESLGFRQFSGTGGQVDYIRGSAMSKGGKSFITLNSTVTDKEGNTTSRITCTLPPGAVVTTARSDAMYIVTEYGIADLYNKSVKDRVEALISIAHPDFREELEKNAKEVGLIK